MKAILTSFGPTTDAQAVGRHTLTPEMSAAVAARHSRMDEGLDGILAKVAGMDQDAAVDNIFKMVDYGHRSIEDMIPISIHLEDISIWLAQYIWSLAQVGGGQESSTRYLKFDKSGLVDPDLLGIKPDQEEAWYARQAACFDRYNRACAAWQSIADKHPGLMNLPDGADEKLITRLKKNYVFDRSRYHLPVTALTRMNVTTWAREWSEICRYLLSSPWAEARTLGEKIRNELGLAAPRMLKHAVYSDDYYDVVLNEIANWEAEAETYEERRREQWARGAWVEPSDGFIQIQRPYTYTGRDVKELDVREMDHRFADDMATHKHRYAPIGRTVKMTAVQYGWDAVALAEIRDMNRHRPGEKDFAGVPQGYYSALDQIPSYPLDIADEAESLQQLDKESAVSLKCCMDQLLVGNKNFIYEATLGVQFPFSHTNTLNKFVYELELRTGKGTHFRYRKHYNDLLEILEKDEPALRAMITAGRGEPE